MLSLRNHSGAVWAYEQALSLAPQSTDHKVNLGLALAEGKRHSDALPLLRAALAAQPSHAVAPCSLFVAQRTACDWRDHDRVLALAVRRVIGQLETGQVPCFSAFHAIMLPVSGEVRRCTAALPRRLTLPQLARALAHAHAGRVCALVSPGGSCGSEHALDAHEPPPPPHSNVRARRQRGRGSVLPLAHPSRARLQPTLRATLLSSDFRESPTGYLLRGAVGGGDSRLEVRVCVRVCVRQIGSAARLRRRSA